MCSAALHQPAGVPEQAADGGRTTCGIQRFKVVEKIEEVKTILADKKLAEAKEYVIKAQVLAGGRGKAHFRNSGFKGGVRLTREKGETPKEASSAQGDGRGGDRHQEGALPGHPLLDGPATARSSSLSPEGGMDIEQVAERTPEAVHKFRGLGLSGKLQEDAAKEIGYLYKMFLKLDALQVEINPLGITSDNSVVCFDAKMNFDENAMFRHEWMSQIQEANAAEEDPRDAMAREYNLNFVPDGREHRLPGQWGRPANFLDVGGGVSQTGVENAFKLIMTDPNVKAVLVNIFGGIVNCEIIAKGLIAAKSVLTVPLVVRVEGTNAERARELLATVPDIIAASNLDDAAQKVVAFAKP
ncbi:Succinate--CoA ligase [GDP-forming] subunit beta, mitochondrial [Tyrophagus putrescentiae]|nr:Succinate--CoA ligase [GDP-forming] subunit beta, mitochondrial [Tyrophagus putrescentiae]